jgi:acyl carrier protein
MDRAEIEPWKGNDISMITDELKSVILIALALDEFEMSYDTTASQVPGWDSLHHVNVILAVERHFGVRFASRDVLRLSNVGDLQKLLDLELSRKRREIPDA